MKEALRDQAEGVAITLGNINQMDQQIAGMAHAIIINDRALDARTAEGLAKQKREIEMKREAAYSYLSDLLGYEVPNADKS
jgi:putative hemolysin